LKILNFKFYKIVFQNVLLIFRQQYNRWTSYYYPDHTNKQFSVLKGALKKLMKGQKVYHDDVNRGQAMYNGHKTFSQLLKKCYVWCDYFAIPQSSLVCERASNERRKTISHNMFKAVQSLPAYVSRARLMIILSPLIQHQNREPASDCDFGSWSKRGWCRLEDMVAKTQPTGKIDIIRVLAADRITIVRGASAENTRTPVGLGEFTCCQVNHNLKGASVPCDLPKVAPVLQSVYRRRLHYYHKTADKWQYRWSLVSQHIVFKGLEKFKIKIEIWVIFGPWGCPRDEKEVSTTCLSKFGPPILFQNCFYFFGTRKFFKKSGAEFFWDYKNFDRREFQNFG